MKRFLTVVAVLFVIYFAFTRPGPTAELVKTVLFGWIPGAADSLATFFTEVLS